MLNALFLSFAAAVQSPATLAVTDQTLGLASAGPSATLITGGDVLFDVGGAPGELALVFADVGPAPASPPLIGGVPILLDPGSALLLAAGALDGAGAFSFGVAVPAALPAGLEVQLQGALLSHAAPMLRATNGISASAFPMLQTLAQGVKSGHPMGGSLPQALVVSDAASWAAFWDLHDGPISSTTPPAVDFEHYAVLCAFFGWFPTGGASIAVEEVALQPGGLVVAATMKIPGPGCGSFFYETHPYHFVLIPAAAAGPVLALQTQLLAPPCP